MNKTLIIQEIIPHYRIPLFNTIANAPEVELTIAHDGTTKFSDQQEIYFGRSVYTIQSIWKFRKLKNLRELIKPYNRIIVIGDLHWLPTFFALLLFKRKSKLYFWGIGMSSEEGLKKKPFLDKLRFFLSDISSGTILYSPKIAEYYVENVKKKNQIFVAKNTVLVEKFPFPTERRTRILSIGSFKKYKNLGNLIIAFNKIVSRLPDDVTLDFIGDGEEEEKLKQLIVELKLNDRVVFWGRKEDDKEIFPIISKAMVCVSPTQAGLAVVHAMAFGCPFLTSADAVTGGERFYIQDNVNGYFYDGSVDELANKILWIVNHQEQNNRIANNAYEFYHNHCNIQNYAASFIDIISNKN